MAILVVWMLFWVFIGPEQRAELKRVFQESTPWVVRESHQTGNKKPRHSARFQPGSGAPVQPWRALKRGLRLLIT
jgi:hypothetical protein